MILEQKSEKSVKAIKLMNERTFQSEIVLNLVSTRRSLSLVSTSRIPANLDSTMRIVGQMVKDI